ncbi:KAP family P-loop NTPase fold protein [Salinibacter sp.]|uniref:KAP family P-loop NTPase fold protein n=1 Tax=Salinibacter sp. TaxID=2065818 RepID=UPI0021E95235|nr:KAP family NTPase [Salinibacter sp.]
MEDRVESSLNREDTPISSLEEDRLGRDTFAIDLANSIRNLPGTDGMVIGIEGSWGEGKTSVLNMIKEALEEDIESVEDLPVGGPDQNEKGWVPWIKRKAESSLVSMREACRHLLGWVPLFSGSQERPEVVEFEPWQLTGVETITRSLFQDMGRAIGRSDDSRATQRLARRMEQLQVAFGAAGDPTSNNFADWFRAVVGVSSVSGLGYSFGLFNIQTVFDAEIFTAKVLVGTISTFGLLASIFGNLSDFLLSESEVQSKTTEELREDVRAELKNREYPLVVIIDDVDRLAPDEMMLLFKLIRASGRFPNVIYLLGLDRRRILNMFDGENVDKDYIDKIVQEMYPLPIIPEGKITEYARGKLIDDNLLGSQEVKRFFSPNKRWDAVFEFADDAYFDTWRDVNRFLGYFRLQIGQLIRSQEFEANAVDLFGLHIIRHFEKPVFDSLSESMKLLCNAPDVQDIQFDRMLDHYADENDFQSRTSSQEEELKSIIDKAHEKRAVEGILSVLFPHAGERLTSDHASMNFDQVNWVLQRRVAHPFFFRAYFEQRPADHPLKHPEEEELRNVASDPEELKNLLLGYQDDKRLIEALHVIREDINSNVFEGFQRDNIIEVLATLELSLMNYEADGENHLDLIGEPSSAIATAEEIVRTIVSQSASDQKKREKQIEALMEPSRAFRLAEQEIVQEENRFPVDAERVENLKRKYVEKIEKSLNSMDPAARRTIDDRDDFGDLVLRFFEWGDAEKATDWLSTLIKDGNLYSVAESFCEQREPNGSADELVCHSDLIKILDGKLSTRDLRDQAMEAIEQALSSESSTWGYEHRVMEAVKQAIEKPGGRF